MTTLVTGASGYLGQEYLKIIIKDVENKYLLLLREGSFLKLSKELKDYPHIELAKGHLQHPDLFVDTRKLEKAKNEVRRVIHLGALYDLSASKEDLYKSNVIGTQNVLFFCGNCLNLKNLVYASTIAVAGDASGPFCEEDYDLGQRLPNDYAQTKFDAEGLVRNWSKGHADTQVDVLRFGVIVGDSQTGEFLKEDGPYYFFKNIGNVLTKAPVLTKLKVVPFPFNGKAVFPMVTVDEAAQAIGGVLESKHIGLKCFHVISENVPAMKKFLEDFLSFIGKPMKVVPLPNNPLGVKLLEKSLILFEMPTALVDYLYLKVLFKTDNYKSLLVQKDYEVFKKAFFSKVVERYLKGYSATGRGVS